MQTKSWKWLLLLYVLPAKRNSARVDLWRKLKRFGAMQLKTSAYVLPDNEAQYERFQWLATEIRDAGGEATVIRAAEIEGVSNEAMVKLFNEAREAEYEDLVRAGQKAIKAQSRDGNRGHAELERLRRRLGEIREIDYFGSRAARKAEAVLREPQRKLEAERKRAAQPRLDRRKFQGSTWVTRPRPGIDRAGSAWLIRKFIDSKARFVFAVNPAKSHGALPFDMADVEFSHHGDDCTFETLVKRFAISDRAVREIAQMVHDADLEDGKFQRFECVGINSVLAGWAKKGLSDGQLLAKGIECFEGLYRWLGAR